MTYDIGERVYVLEIDTYGKVVGGEKNGEIIVDTAVGHPTRGEIEVSVSDVRKPKNVPLGDIESVGGV